jgi:hypothetical protein
MGGSMIVLGNEADEVEGRKVGRSEGRKVGRSERNLLDGRVGAILVG